MSLVESIPAAQLNNQIHFRPLDRTLPGERQAATANDWLCLPMDMAQAACHTAIQSPINSLTQMLAPDYLPNLQIIDAPAKVEELSPRWHAQQLGSALGAAADIAALEVACRGALPPAAIGACYDGLLRPVEGDAAKMSLQDQLLERTKNAAIGGAGFATLYGANKALSGLEKTGEAATWKSLAGNRTLTSTLSAIPSGLLTTALSGGRSMHDFALGTYTSAIGGLGLGAIHAHLEKRALAENQDQEIARLREEVETDSLTGLGNQKGSKEVLRKEVARSLRTGQPLSIIFGDLDGFKAVNDHLGHTLGSETLTKVGQSIRSQLRLHDYAARWGGDEFMVVLPDTDQASARVFASRLQNAVTMEVGPQDNRHQVGISLGVITRAQNEIDPAEFQQRADLEMYRVKNERKAQFNL